MNQSQFIDDKPEDLDETPPIPPNCNFFCPSTHPDLQECTCFAIAEREMIHSYDIDDLIEENEIYWRPIIAAVARCAWLDIATEHFRFQVPSMDGYPGKKPDNKAGWQANKNSEAWRIWGSK